MMDPARQLKLDEQELAAGRRVTLIGTQGKPSAYHWPIKPGAVVPVPDGVFSVNSFDACLVELLPPAKRAPFRLTAEVRHEEQLGMNEIAVGLYIGYSKQASALGDDHCYCSFGFDDLSEPTTRNGLIRRYQAVLQARRTRVEPHKLDGNATTGVFINYEPVPTTQHWRRIALEVTAEHVTVLWEGEPIGKVALGVVQGRFQNFLNPSGPDRLSELKPTFSPEGGIGLFVLNGGASFRNVIIEPLHENH
jgi:hypothetical protein